MSPRRISAILPCFEEAAGLPGLVARLGARLARAAPDGSEILLVTTAAARDGTPAVARDLARRYAGVRVVDQPADDLGYGRALALGIAAARHPWLLLLDADGQMDPVDLPRLVEAAAKADVVIGFRPLRIDPLPRRLAGKLYRVVAPRLVGLRGIRDLDCGFKLFRSRVLGPEPLSSRTGVVNAEILTRAVRAGARIVQIPVTHRSRTGGRSRFELALGVPSPSEVAAILADLRALRGHD